ncbi:MAG TPA: hypothetical protein VLS51_00670, partial [Propionibacteriaceae bacterium]|nr:hypothetical protein [Propionibacteriaceae bacterium]
LGDGDLGRVDGAAELRDPRTAVARGDVALSDGQVSVHVVGELDQQDDLPEYNPGEAYRFLSGTDAFPGPRLLVPFRSPSGLRLVVKLA